MNYTKNDIESVTLLSIEEYRKNKDIIPVSRSWWWIRSPGTYKKNAAYVFIDGEAYQEGYKVYSNSASVRPVFYLRPEIMEGLRPMDKVVIGNFPATVLSNGACLLDSDVCNHRFDEDDNNWEQSEIKQFIESNAFMDIIFNRVG